MVKVLVPVGLSFSLMPVLILSAITFVFFLPHPHKRQNAWIFRLGSVQQPLCWLHCDVGSVSDPVVVVVVVVVNYCTRVCVCLHYLLLPVFSRCMLVCGRVWPRWYLSCVCLFSSQRCRMSGAGHDILAHQLHRPFLDHFHTGKFLQKSLSKVAWLPLRALCAWPCNKVYFWETFAETLQCERGLTDRRCACLVSVSTASFSSLQQTLSELWCLCGEIQMKIDRTCLSCVKLACESRLWGWLGRLWNDLFFVEWDVKH